MLLCRHKLPRFKVGWSLQILLQKHHGNTPDHLAHHPNSPLVGRFCNSCISIHFHVRLYLAMGYPARSARADPARPGVARGPGLGLSFEMATTCSRQPREGDHEMGWPRHTREAYSRAFHFHFFIFLFSCSFSLSFYLIFFYLFFVFIFFFTFFFFSWTFLKIMTFFCSSNWFLKNHRFQKMFIIY